MDSSLWVSIFILLSIVCKSWCDDTGNINTNVDDTNKINTTIDNTDNTDNTNTLVDYLRGSCKCPKPGKGGYETYNRAQKQFNNLWSNVTNIYKHIRANRDKIKTKCPETRCDNTLTKVQKVQAELEQLKTVNVTALEETVVTMMALIKALQAKVNTNTANIATNFAAIANKCDATKCSSLDTNLNKMVNCFGDVTSTDCPSSPNGKTGIIASVASTTTALSNKCDTAKCDTIEADLDKVEKCFSDKASADCPAAAAGKVSVTGAINALENCFGDVTSTDCPSSPNGKTGIIASIASTTTALSNKCDTAKCDTIEADLDKVEKCFSDKTSADCPAAATGKVSVTDAIKALEEPPIFNCGFYGGDLATTGALTPLICDVNEGNVVTPSTGVFTVAKAGKYRLTFMARTIPVNKKKVFCVLVKTSLKTETKIGRSVAQTKVGNEEEQITTTIDIIHELNVGETVHVYIQVTGGAKIRGDAHLSQQVTFTGEFLRS